MLSLLVFFYLSAFLSNKSTVVCTRSVIILDVWSYSFWQRPIQGGGLIKQENNLLMLLLTTWTSLHFILHPSPSTAPAASITTPRPTSVPEGGRCESLMNKNGYLTNLSTIWFISRLANSCPPHYCFLREHDLIHASHHCASSSISSTHLSW